MKKHQKHKKPMHYKAVISALIAFTLIMEFLVLSNSFKALEKSYELKEGYETFIQNQDISYYVYLYESKIEGIDTMYFIFIFIGIMILAIFALIYFINEYDKANNKRGFDFIENKKEL
ncbi:MAG: hypothetical protein ACP5OG_00885 [Candidatus Nanoarchaeia archaeon]